MSGGISRPHTIAVVAANGRSGSAFVAAALSAGHQVRAGVHGSNDFVPNKNLTVLTCDATNENDVRQLLDGADVVVSLIGHGKNSPQFLQTDSIKMIVKAMQEKQIRRLISLTGTGVRSPGDTPSIIDRIANRMILCVDPARIADGIKHARFIETTGLDWTIIRVLKLGSGKSTRNVQFSLTGPAEMLTPRSRVASAIVQLIEDGSYVQQSPIIIGEK